MTINFIRVLAVIVIRDIAKTTQKQYLNPERFVTRYTEFVEVLLVGASSFLAK